MRLKPAAGLLGAAAMLLSNAPEQAKPMGMQDGPTSEKLEQVCRADSLRRAFAGLSPAVTIGPIPNGPAFPGGAHFTPATEFVPAYCQVTGSYVTNPDTGKTANFLATLPANWNGKYLQLGCGSNCGKLFATNNAADPGSVVTLQSYPLMTIVKGYASFANDGGHVGYDVNMKSWTVAPGGGTNVDGTADFYYRASLVLADLGKAMTKRFYAAMNGTESPPVSRSYFQGCSGGGRDALVAATNFPEKFDGIIAGSPYGNPLRVSLQYAGEMYAQLRSESAELPPFLAERIGPIVTARCDAADGVRDGVIQNPMACNFRADRDLPRCNGKTARNQCFTQAEIETVSTHFSAVTDEHGRILQPGFSVSEPAPLRLPRRPADIGAADPFPPDDPTASRLWFLGDGNMRFLALADEPGFHSRPFFTFGRTPGQVDAFHTIVPAAFDARLQQISTMGIGTDPVRADKLMASRTKLLLWSNLSDTALTPYMAINYYKQLAGRYGGYARLQQTARLFALPGTDHCSGKAVGPSAFDPLAAMEAWVEQGKPPQALVAGLYDPAKPGADPKRTPLRTMPLCTFPIMARYSGRGDINDAANWSCPAGDRSMLRVGTAGRLAGVEP